MRTFEKLEATPWFRGAAVTGSLIMTVAGAWMWADTRAAAQTKDTANSLHVMDAKIEAKDAGMRDELRLLRSDLEARQRQTEQKVEAVGSEVRQVLQELRKQRR